MATAVKTFLDPTPFTVRVSTTGGTGGAAPAGVISLATYGGVADGTTDNTAALVRAIAAAQVQRLPMYFGDGDWHFTGTVSLPAGVEVFGSTSAVLTWTAPWYTPLFTIKGDDVTVHDLTFVSTGGAQCVVGGATNFSRANVYNLDLRGCAINSLFGCIDATISNCTVDGSTERATLTAPIVTGNTYTSLPVSPVSAALSKGTQLYIYADPTYADETFQVVYTSAAVAAGATSLPITPLVAAVDLPSGASVRQIVVSTGIAMTGAYENWNTTPGPGGSWVVTSTIKNCTVRNCDAADIFINMGYQCTMEDNYGSVGHDMNFDFEYCYQSVMQNNEGHFGGNRGCAVETINSECQVLNNKLYDTLWDGIRVTSDITVAGNPRTAGGHLVKGNYVRRANRGIAFQAVGSTMAGNDVAECLLTGAHLYNESSALVTGNNFHDNCGTGVELLNSSTAANPVTVSGNTIARNGYLNGVAPVRAAPTVTVAAGTSTLAAGTYAVSYGWTATVAARGGLYHTYSSVSVPALVTVTAGQVMHLEDITLPAGVDGIVVCVLPESYVTGNTLIPWYAKPGGTLQDFALAIGGLVLGEVAADGTITYDGGATSGLVATASGGTLSVTITGAATLGGQIVSRSFANASGIWADPATGGVAGVVMQDNTITDNGMAGVLCPGTVTAGTIGTHTAAGVLGVATASGVSVSDAVFGIYPAASSGHGSFVDCAFSGLDVDGIHFSPAINGQCWDYTINGCTFSGMPVGIYMSAAVSNGRGGGSALAPFPGDASAPVQPTLVENCTFTNVQTPVDTDGGTQDVITIGSGNVGV